MIRRTFLSFLCLGAASACGIDTKIKKFKFRIRTETKGIINTVLEGQDLDHAKSKLYKRYPNCTVLSAQQL